MNTRQITTHYADGRPSETRDMTPEEIALIPVSAESGLIEASNSQSIPD